jgi:hypothetical protein
MLFIHLGEDIVIQAQEVIAIFDFELSESSSEMKGLVKHYRTREALMDIGGELNKSIVLTNEKVFLSPLSSVTLKRRSQMIHEFDNRLMVGASPHESRSVGEENVD